MPTLLLLNLNLPLAIFTITLTLFSLWLYTVYTCTTFPTLTNKRILLLTAHPDDEAMFFAPTVLHLTNPALGNHLKIMCLSTGTAGGWGEVRKEELFKSGGILGLRDPRKDVIIVDEPDLQDSATWSPTQITTLLTHLFIPTLAQTPTSKPLTAQIDVLLTFDATGISSHHNHIACHTAALSFLSAITAKRAGWTPPVAVYTLTSVPIWRKYIGGFDCLGTMLSVTLAMFWGGVGGKKKWGKGKGKGKGGLVQAGGLPEILLCVSGIGGVWKGWKAMVVGHRSQMLWFRWGWIASARYMLVNDLRRVR